MTITLKDRNKYILTLENVKSLEANCTILYNTSGYRVTYNDNTINLYSNRNWKLIKIEQ